MYQNTTVVALPPKKSLQGKDLVGLKDKSGLYPIKALYEKAKNGGGFIEYVWPKPGAGDTLKLGYAELIPGTGMWIGTGVYLDNIASFIDDLGKDLHGVVRNKTVKMAVVAGLIFAGIIAVCLVIVFGITQALKQLNANFKDIAEGEGDLTKRIYLKSKDELAELAERFNTFMEKLQGIIGRISENSSSVDRSATELTEIAAHMSTGADETSQRADSVSVSTEELSTNLHAVATAMEESSTIATAEIATNISPASQGMQEVNENVSQSSVAAAEITEDITTVNASAGEISESSNQVKASAQGLQLMAKELHNIVGSFKI